MNKGLIVFLLLVAVGLIALSQSLYIVDQREQAILLQLGQPVGGDENIVKKPGLHLKIPMVQNVVYFDSRILSVDPEPEQVVISSDYSAEYRRNQTIDETPDQESEPSSSIIDANESGEPIIVDSFARYKIVDPLRFLKTLRTVDRANQRLKNILNDATRTVLGRTTLRTLLSEERNAVMTDIRTRMNTKIEQDELGVEIVDVRIVRADLTPSLRESTVKRMNSELRERATETRAKGEERALEIRSTAERQRTVTIAEAQRDSQILRGQGDEEAIKIYANAFNKDQEFYSFIRSMEAYRNTLADQGTRLILSPNSEFFRYFKTIENNGQ